MMLAQRVAIEQFRLDLPDGVYELTFHFAELTRGQKRLALGYNLAGNEQKHADKSTRSFQIAVK
jgi:beta-galactosidase